MQKSDPDGPPVPQQPISADDEAEMTSTLDQPQALSIVTALVSTLYMALTLAELSIQLTLLAVATAIDFIPVPQPVNGTVQLSSSTGPTEISSDSGRASARTSIEHIDTPPSSPSSTVVQLLPEPRTFRPHYLPIRDFLRLFPHTDAPDAPWHATESMRSEDADLYDDHGEYDHGLQLWDLTQEDLEMDDIEAAEVTHSNMSVTETFGLIPSPVSSLSATSSVTSPSPDIIMCPNCRMHRNHYNFSRPEAATLDNIGWHCSPPSESAVWFVVAVGRRISVFDNWFVFLPLDCVSLLLT